MIKKYNSIIYRVEFSPCTQDTQNIYNIYIFKKYSYPWGTSSFFKSNIFVFLNTTLYNDDLSTRVASLKTNHEPTISFFICCSSSFFISRSFSRQFNHIFTIRNTILRINVPIYLLTYLLTFLLTFSLSLSFFLSLSRLFCYTLSFVLSFSLSLSLCVTPLVVNRLLHQRTSSLIQRNAHVVFFNVIYMLSLTNPMKASHAL